MNGPTAETYERAIHALSRLNHRLTVENARLKKRIEMLLQEQLDELQDRSRMVEAIDADRRN